jgi:hypothetical protein
MAKENYFEFSHFPILKNFGMTEIFKIRKIIQNTNKNYFMRYKMGVINLFFEINYFKHKISAMF